MAGRKRKMTIEEELAYLDQEIAKKQEELQALRDRKDEVAQMKEEAELKLLYEKIKASGKTVSEFLESIE